MLTDQTNVLFPDQGGVFLATFPQWPRLVGPLYEHRIRVSQRIQSQSGVVFLGRLKR